MLKIFFTFFVLSIELTWTQEQTNQPPKIIFNKAKSLCSMYTDNCFVSILAKKSSDPPLNVNDISSSSIQTFKISKV